MRKNTRRTAKATQRRQTEKKVALATMYGDGAVPVTASVQNTLPDILLRMSRVSIVMDNGDNEPFNRRVFDALANATRMAGVAIFENSYSQTNADMGKTMEEIAGTLASMTYDIAASCRDAKTVRLDRERREKEYVFKA